MSTARTWQIQSTSLENTLALAEQIGRNMKGGEVIELISDLGGGKTTFVRGLAKGMGSDDTVSSPSFTLSNEYHADKLTLYHFDFYRLSEPGITRDELQDILGEPDTVVAIEWADIVEDVLPLERLRINITPTDETKRVLTMEYPETLKYLVPINT